MDTLQYKDIFISESLEHLDFLNQMLLALEKNPSDRKCLNEIFRTAHTLKGMAATMGFDQITELTHQMENVLDKLRSQEESVSENVVDVLFQCLDMLTLLIEEGFYRTLPNGARVHMFPPISEKYPGCPNCGRRWVYS